MGCYGIGVSRIIAAAIEQSHDSDGIIWPMSIAPFKFALVEIDGFKNDNVREFANKIYRDLIDKEIEIIFDDRETKLGNKLNDWELIGVPDILIIGKSEAENESITLKKRGTKDKSSFSVSELMNFVQS